MAHNWSKGTPPFREFVAMVQADRNLWWTISSGHHQNLFYDAVAEIERLEKVIADHKQGERDGGG